MVCLFGVLKVSGKDLERTWNVSGIYLEGIGVLEVSGGCPGGNFPFSAQP